MALQLSISVFPCDDAATARSALDPPRAVPLPRGLLEEAVGGPVEDAYVVNALDMPLFQFLSARRPQSSPLLELALIYPAFATQPELEVDMKLVHAVMTASVKEFLSCEALAEIGHDETVHVGALAFIKPGSLILQCVRKRVVNLRTGFGSTQHAHRLAPMVPRVQKSWCLLTSCAC